MGESGRMERRREKRNIEGSKGRTEIKTKGCLMAPREWKGGREVGTEGRMMDGWIMYRVLPKMLVFQHVFLQHVVQARICSSSNATNSKKPGLV